MRAMIDGANPLQIFWHIILPLSKAVLAVVALFYGVALWSDYFNPLLYLNNTAMWPIPLVLRLYVLQGKRWPAPRDGGATAAAGSDDPDGGGRDRHGADPVRLSVPAAVLHPGGAVRRDQGLNSDR